MSVWILLLLCVVQGLTEFLPVSSSGHLLFFEQVFHVSGNLMFLNLFLHIATLLAVVIVYRKIIWELIKKPFQPYTFKLAFATLFSVGMAFLYEFLNLDSVITKVYPFGFLLTSVLLATCHLFQKKSVVLKSGEISTGNAALVGIVQGFAVIPGLSRSGSTIASLMLCGNDEKKSSEFSFLLSIPIIIGGFVLEILQLKNEAANYVANFNFLIYLLAFVLTFVVSIVALKLTIKLLKKQKFVVFSIYTFLMFIITLILNFA